MASNPAFKFALLKSKEGRTLVAQVKESKQVASRVRKIKGLAFETLPTWAYHAHKAAIKQTAVDGGPRFGEAVKALEYAQTGREAMSYAISLFE